LEEAAAGKQSLMQSHLLLQLARRIPGARRAAPRIGALRLQGGEALEVRLLLAFDPSPVEQAYLEGINRMRLNPQAELDVLFQQTSPDLIARDASVQAALDFFDVDATLLLQQWNQLRPVAPLAWNSDLRDAALGHNQQLINADEQSHQVDGEAPLGERVANAGYTPLRRVTENVYAFAEDPIHGYAGFVIDWGDGPGGIQDPAGHRDNYMDPGVREVGISVVTETNPATFVAPTLVTQNFGRRSGYESQLVGVVYADSNQNGIYDAGEGRSNVQIDVVGTEGTFSTTTMSAGGYQLVLPPGTYQVTASGPSIAGAIIVDNVAKGSPNLKVDFELTSSPVAPTAVNDLASTQEDTPVTINVLDNDLPSSDELERSTVEVIESPAYGSTSVNPNGQIVYTPQPNYNGSDSFTYAVRDRNSQTSNAGTVQITIGQVADAPLAEDLVSNVAEDTSIVISLSDSVTDSDNDIDWSSLQLVDQPNNGQVIVDHDNQSLSYTPRVNFFGADTLKYRIADLSGNLSNTAEVTIAVSSVNDLPIAQADLFTIVDGRISDLPVIANDRDIDGDLRGIQIVTGPTLGLATNSGTQIQYEPFDDAIGSDVLEYRVRDGEGAYSETVTVTVFLVSQDKAWQNPVNNLDVNGDGFVSPLDALEVINRIGDTLGTEFRPSLPGLGPPPFVDVNADQSVSPIDALLIINVLGVETPPPAASLAASSAVFRWEHLENSLGAEIQPRNGEARNGDVDSSREEPQIPADLQTPQIRLAPALRFGYVDDLFSASRRITPRGIDALFADSADDRDASWLEASMR